ncbi:hypothetical protein DVU_0476 [Nitratidesulfovibrio vulgaris str. Hildenborough]|uniref:Uncharacterized protein n=1 Tax=Nitratidesulfovibrio vulgaris (strain ATCC 29579 / DSM 644 / CCUG 34227 / NCIMB 8303 / VKM B-1760 / Hildenborough) TaxID=882 RepID=Q72EU2_NITV2|nr:hypothetical protein DVU_0476 [Nitratidesulfovibrio vulgaris str. Hildenborough]
MQYVPSCGVSCDSCDVGAVLTESCVATRSRHEFVWGMSPKMRRVLDGQASDTFCFWCVTCFYVKCIPNVHV